MLKRFYDLKVATKLSIFVAAMAVPVAIMVVLFLRATNVLLATAVNEQRGVVHVRPLDDLLESLNEHRDLALATISGATDQSTALNQAGSRVSQAIVSLESQLNADADPYSMGPLVTGVKAKWEAVRLRRESASLDQTRSAYGDVIADVRQMIRKVVDDSELILDPVLPSYYLMNVATIQVPDIGINLANLRGLDVQARLVPVTPIERASAQGDVARLRRDFEALDRSLSVALSGEPSLGPLVAVQKAAVEEAEAYFRRVAARVEVPAPAATSGVADAYAEGQRAIAAFAKLQDASQNELTRLLQGRASDLRRQQFVQGGVGLIGLLLAIGLATWVVRSITAPVKNMMGVFGSIGMGDFKARTQVQSADELGALGSSVNAMLDSVTSLMQSREERDQMQQSVMKLLDEVSGVGGGDLTAEAEVTADMTGAIADSFNQMIAQLRQVIGDVKGATVRVTKSAQEIQATTNALAEGSETQAEEIVSAAAAIDEMATSIGQVSANATSSAAVAEQARTNAEQGARAVGRTLEGMASIREQVQETSKRIKRLGESSQEIGEIVQLIGDIADRTSILALNASIQAAMAGEAGRGFAVVAGEVERLAERATEATKRISTLIKTTQTETAEAVAAMEDTTKEVVNGSAIANEASTALSEIKTVSNRLAELIQAISDASQQQARGSEQVARSMGQISQHTRNTASETKGAAQAIGSLAGLASELNTSMSRFKLPESASRRDRAA